MAAARPALPSISDGFLALFVGPAASRARLGPVSGQLRWGEHGAARLQLCEQLGPSSTSAVHPLVDGGLGSSCRLQLGAPLLWGKEGLEGFPTSLNGRCCGHQVLPGRVSEISRWVAAVAGAAGGGAAGAVAGPPGVIVGGVTGAALGGLGLLAGGAWFGNLCRSRADQAGNTYRPVGSQVNLTGAAVA